MRRGWGSCRSMASEKKRFEDNIRPRTQREGERGLWGGGRGWLGSSTVDGPEEVDPCEGERGFVDRWWPDSLLPKGSGKKYGSMHTRRGERGQQEARGDAGLGGGGEENGEGE